jgi:DNA-directed RNA polymerase specialized sigma24 family protein
VSNHIEGAKRGRTRNELIAAYEAYQRGEPRSFDVLLQKVQKFATSKLIHLEHDFVDFGTAENADDWAQEVTIKVWQGMNVTRTSESFYAWVHKIAFNQASASFNELSEEQDKKVGLTKPIKDSYNGSLDAVKDNPEIYETSGVSTSIYIPPSVQGLDLDICKLILDGMTYTRIAKELKITESNVKKRLERLRTRIAAERKTEREELRPTT